MASKLENNEVEKKDDMGKRKGRRDTEDQLIWQ